MGRAAAIVSALLLGSAATSALAAPRLVSDVPYGTGGHPRRQLDIYSPDTTGRTPLPVVVYVHGGGWFKGDKSKVGEKPEWLARLGWVLVSVNYRLLPEGRHPANAADVAEAVAWVRGNIGEYGGDPESIFLAGHSAGAHLAALVAVDERFLAAHALAPEALAGVIALDTDCYDVAARVHSLAPEDRGLYLAAFGVRPAGWRDASPLAHVAAGAPLPPFLLLTAAETSSTHAQAAAFARTLERAGARVLVKSFPAESHGSLNGRLGKPGHDPTAAVERFLGGGARGGERYPPSR